MPLPECVKRLLPDDLPFDEVLKISAKWAVKEIPIHPILRTKDNSIAICDTEQQITPSLQEIDGGEVWYSIDRLQDALNIARRLNIDRVFLTQTAVNGKIAPPLSIVGKDSMIAIVVAPNIAWNDSDEEEREEPAVSEADI